MVIGAEFVCILVAVFHFGLMIQFAVISLWPSSHFTPTRCTAYHHSFERNCMATEMEYVVANRGGMKCVCVWVDGWREGHVRGNVIILSFIMSVSRGGNGIVGKVQVQGKGSQWECTGV